MKKLLSGLLLTLLFSGCQKDQQDDGAVITGKVIHRSCANVVIEVLDTAYFYLGQTWTKRGTDEESFQHVFTTNPCSFMNSSAGKGEVIRFKLSEGCSTGCVVCALYEEVPQKFHEIKLLD